MKINFFKRLFRPFKDARLSIKKHSSTCAARELAQNLIIEEFKNKLLSQNAWIMDRISEESALRH